jgi:hypothetical protein
MERLGWDCGLGSSIFLSKTGRYEEGQSLSVPNPDHEDPERPTFLGSPEKVRFGTSEEIRSRLGRFEFGFGTIRGRLVLLLEASRTGSCILSGLLSELEIGACSWLSRTDFMSRSGERISLRLPRTTERGQHEHHTRLTDITTTKRQIVRIISLLL